MVDICFIDGVTCSNIHPEIFKKNHKLPSRGWGNFRILLFGGNIEYSSHWGELVGLFGSPSGLIHSTALKNKFSHIS